MQLSDSLIETNSTTSSHRAYRQKADIGSLGTFLFSTLVLVVGTATKLISLNIIPYAAAANFFISQQIESTVLSVFYFPPDNSNASTP
ncbi:hypothetical protein SAMN02745220_01780 [Desulfopila aestuarii DSM 18488]|uniref:Uncharacterized protein n=1 Tax=Desulfopila aestuarii DSM 18488 TaxID=1121416 RepID=A0A1M7Y4G9_9BACT|nr:hypothetical protein SAMN02745220_01780 [Desulfopila aestuarii DSM 18488]